MAPMGEAGGEAASSDEAGDDGGSGTEAIACDPSVRRDVVYAVTEAAPELNALDVWPLRDEGASPIVIWVHGGGWVEGDKAGHEGFPGFRQFFADEGFALVPVNYRLVGDPRSPDTTYAEQTQDLAHAVAWVHEHATELCGDPDRIVLVGHSAGAHLVSLVATDPRYLRAAGLEPSILAGVVALDVNAYDITYSIEHGAEHDYPAAAINLPEVFGYDPAAHLDASSITHVGAADAPPQLVVSAPVQTGGIVQSLSRAVSERYVDALVAAGEDARFFHAEDATHSSLVIRLGAPGDPTTLEVRDFLSAR